MKGFDQPMETGSEEEALLQYLSSDDNVLIHQTVRNIRNSIIGMKKNKIKYVKAGLIDKLLELMAQNDTDITLAIESATILGCLARGDPDNLRHILDSQTIPILCKGVCSSNERLVMACLLSLRICYMSNQVPEDLIFEDPDLVATLIQLLKTSPHAAECAANILQRSCKTVKDQCVLYEAGIVPALVTWIYHKQSAVLVPILGCLMVVVHKNEVVAAELYRNIKDQLLTLIMSHQTDEVRLGAAICLTKTIRALPPVENMRKVEEKLLSVFVTMCEKEKPIFVRIKAASFLAYLIEDNEDLQQIGSISNHLLKNISYFFVISKSSSINKETIQNLRESAFQLMAALAANDETIRKQIVDNSCNLATYINEAIKQEEKVSLQAAALQCLLSLSRSVQQLRTTFQDVKMWEPVISALKSSNDDNVISVASSVLCNLLLDFSPCKEVLVDYGALEVLMALIRRDEVPFRINGVWGLMNLLYDADDVLKAKIVEEVGIENILGLISDNSIDVAVKALGILRNLLTDKEQEIDKLMRVYGQGIINTIRPLVINDTLGVQLKEQVLCLLSNIANGSYAKDIIFNEDSIMEKIVSYITHENEQLQIASVYCVTNLVRNENNLSSNWKFKMRELGTEKQLKTLLQTANADLQERAKVALQQFE